MVEQKNYGHGINVLRVRKGDADEYKVRIGNFPVKNFSDEEEADDHARKLLKEKRKEI